MKSKVYIEKNYSDIQYVDKNGITFKNGDKIIFADCTVREDVGSSKTITFEL